MTHACTTAGDETGVWAYCTECGWMGAVYTPTSRRHSELPYWFEVYVDIDEHQRQHS